MTSQEFVRLAKTFVVGGDPLEYLNKLLRKLSETHVSLRPLIHRLTEVNMSSSEFPQSSKDFRALLDSTSQDVRTEFRTQGVWAGVEELRRRLEQFRSLDVFVELAEQMGTQLNHFSETYEQFV